MVNNKRKSNYFQFTVKEEGQYHISIYQETKRKFIFDKKYEYSGARIILLKRSGSNSMTYVGSKNKASYGCTLDVKLELGIYIVSTKVIWKTWDTH